MEHSSTSIELSAQTWNKELKSVYLEKSSFQPQGISVIISIFVIISM